MEAIGVGLGTAALVSTVLEVFRVVTSFRTHAEATAILFRQLELEREVLMRWAIEVGLCPVRNHPSASCAIPAPLLPLVHRSVASTGGLLAKATSVDRSAWRPEPDLHDLELALSSLQGQFQVEQKQARQSRLARSLSRLGWAIGEEERLKDLISTIHTYNASLHNLVPKPLQVRLDGSLMQSLFFDKDQGELVELQMAGLRWRKAISAAAAVTALQQTRSGVAPPSTNQLMLQRSKFTSIGRDMARYLTRYEYQGEQVPVLVEWRAYLMGKHSDKKFQYLNTCFDLVRLLHASQNLAEYRTMDCIGVFDDVEFKPPRIGLIYRVPPVPDPRSISNLGAPDDSIRIYTLFDLINRKEFPRPRLDQRFELARSLATGLHRLFVSRWYHKNLNSRNILFFGRADSPTNNPKEKERPHLSEEGATSPFLSGFDYARPDTPEEITIKRDMDEFADRYRHPQCTHPETRETIRYSRHFDIYSLGILLLELGRWETIDRVQKDFVTQRMKSQEKAHGVAHGMAHPPSLQEFQRYLRTKGVESLGFRMGKIYMDAVRVCLDGGEYALGGSEVPDPALEELLVDQFNREVVAELAKCTV